MDISNSMGASGDELRFDETNYVVLQPPKSGEWNRLLVTILMLPQMKLWRSLIMVDVQVSYTVACAIVFLPVELNLTWYIPVMKLYIVLDLIYAFDVFLLFLHNYWKKIDVKFIARKTAVRFLITDIISLIPQSQLLVLCLGYYSATVVYLRLLVILRLCRLRFFYEMVHRVQQNRLLWIIIEYSVIIFIICYLSTCLWLYMGCSGWTCHLSGSGTWIRCIEGRMKQFDQFDQYFIVGFYSVVNFITNTGMGDIYATTITEKVFVVFLMIVGVIIIKTLFCSALVLQLVNLWTRRTEFIYKLTKTKEYLVEINAPKEIIEEVMEYYKIFWWHKSGVKDAPYLEIIPGPLRTEIAYDINYQFMQRSLLFKDQEESFFRGICLLTKNIFLLPGEKVFYKDVVKIQMIYICRGVLEILSDEDDQSPIISFKAGTILGEISLYMCIPAKATVRAAEYTEIIVLERVDFMKAMSQYRDVSKTLWKKLTTRIKSAKSSMQTRQDMGTVLNLLVSDEQEMRPIKVIKDRLSHRKKVENVAPKSFHEQMSLESKQSHERRGKIYEGFLPLYKLSPNVTNIARPNICWNYKFPWILDPKSSFIVVWDNIILITQFTYIMVLFYHVCFERHIPTQLKMVRLFAEIHYGCATGLKFITAVVIKDKTITEVKHITQYVLRTYTFYMDVFSLLPFDFIYTGFTLDAFKIRIRMILNLNVLLRVYRLIFFFREQETTLTTDLLGKKIIKFILYILIMLLWIAGVCYLLACLMEICLMTSWYFRQMVTEVETHAWRISFETPFILFYYYASFTFLLVGFGNLIPGNIAEFAITSLSQILGTMLYCAFLSQVTSLIILQTHPERLYRRTIASIQTHLVNSRAHPKLIKRVLDLFSLQWYCALEVGRRNFFETAPNHLKTAIQNIEMMDFLKEIELFKIVPIDYLVIICKTAKTEILPPDEVVFYSGDMTREMYILQKGHCHILSSNGKILQMCTVGAHFGHLEMIFGFPKRYTIKTVTNCKFIVVEYRTYLHAMSSFPRIYGEVKEIVTQRDLIKAVERIDKDRIEEGRMAKVPVVVKRDVLNAVNNFFGRSFILTLKNCKRSNGKESYWKPFQEMGRWRFLGYFLLPLTINHQGPFFKFWCISRLIIILAYAITGPIYAAMSLYSYNLYYVFGLAYVTSCLDIYVFLFITYHNSEGILITHPKYTAKYYITHSFLLDLLAVAPYRSIVEKLASKKIASSYNYLCSLTLLLQTHRLVAHFLYLEKNVLSPYIIYMKYLQVVVPLLLFINFLAGVLFNSECSYIFTPVRHSNDLSEVIVANGTAITYGYLRCNNGSWVQPNFITDGNNPKSLYLLCFYWITTIITQVGTGDMVPHYAKTMLFTIFLMILGVVVIVYMYGTLSSEHSQFASELIMFQTNVRYLKRFMRKGNVNPELRTRVAKHFRHKWKRTCKVNNQDLRNRLNTALLEDTLAFLYEPTLREVPLFENVEKSFVRIIAKHLTEEHFLKGDTIVNCSDVHSNIYVIHSGKVEILNSRFEMLACMGPGGLFGNIRQVTPGISDATITATRSVDLLVIKSEKFYTIMDDYPKVKQMMGIILKTVTNYIVPTTLIEGKENRSINISIDTHGTSEESENEEVIESTQEQKSSSAVSIRTSDSSKHDFISVHQCQTCMFIFLPHKWFRFVLLPDHHIFSVTWISAFIATFINSMTIPYAFVTQDDSEGLIYFSILLEPIFYVKIFYSLHKSYLSRDGVFVTSNKKILRHCVKQKIQFAVEMIANFPWELFCFCFKGNRLLAFSGLRLMHLIRVYCAFVSFKKASRDVLGSHACKLLVVKTAMVIAFIFNLSACVWIFVACPNFDCVHKAEIAVSDKIQVYVNSLYYAVSMGTFTGLGDLHPNGETETIVTIITIIGCKIMMAFIFGDVITIVHIMLKTIIQYESRIYHMQSFLKNQHLSDYQMAKLKRYTGILWQNEHGRHMPELLDSCPYVLRCELMTAMYGHHIRNSDLFKGISEQLLRQIAEKLQRVVFFEGNLIAQSGDKYMNIYIIHTGLVSVITIHPSLMETHHEVLGASDMFGHTQGLYEETAFQYCYRAQAKTEILVLGFHSWSYVLQHFPDDRKIIYARARNLFRKM